MGRRCCLSVWFIICLRLVSRYFLSRPLRCSAPSDNLPGRREVRTVTKYFGILTIISLWANHVSVAKRLLLRRSPVTWSWAAFLVLAGVLGVCTLPHADTFSALYTIIGLFLIYLSAKIEAFTKRNYSLLTKFVIGGGVAAAVYTVGIYLKGISLPQSMRASLIWGLQRKADPNHFATSLILPLLFALEWLTRPGPGHRIWASPSVVAIAMTVLLTGSRGGALGAAGRSYYCSGGSHI